MGIEGEMRLAFIKKRFSTHGGAERYLQTLINYLKKEGHEIHVFANQWAQEEGIIFHKVSILPFSSVLSTLTFNMNTNSMIKTQRSKLDCVISLERTTYQDIYRAGDGCHAEWLKIRAQAEAFYKKLSFKINPLHIALLGIEERLFKNTPLIIANSEMVKKQIMYHYAVPEGRIKIIYNGVDLKRFCPDNKLKWRDAVRKSLDMPEDALVVLFVGSGFERKGLRTLFKALPLIKGYDVHIVAIGKGDVDRYKALSEEYGMSGKTTFLGPQADIEKFYAAADIFALPTLYDPFSNATIEAMASGLPVITTKNNGASELIENGQEGYVSDNIFDHHELASKIILSLSSLKQMGERARQKAEAFPIERAVNELINIIHH
ncbi:MAG: glycosyltransferase family 4 protein [Nitrospirae bacterium]|nr:glycosyltransferase family 4 protein [Nitrospirota bacterium]